MKLHKKILGILTLIIALIGLGITVLIIIDGSDSDKIPALFLFIPVYILLHYSVITRLGFDNVHEKNSRINLIGTIIILGLTLVFPFRYGIEYYMTKNIEQSLNQLKDWGIDENKTTGIIGTLRTKYDSKKLLYHLDLSGHKDSYHNLESVIIHLEDDDLFIVELVEIPLDASDDNITSFESNDTLIRTIKGSTYFNSIDYQKIKYWELITRKK